MYGVSRRATLEKQQARTIEACRYGGGIGSGLLARDEWQRSAMEAAETTRLCREAGLLGAGNQSSLRARFAAAIRRIPAPRARTPRSTSYLRACLTQCIGIARLRQVDVGRRANALHQRG